jgi:hypothetical protein
MTPGRVWRRLDTRDSVGNVVCKIKNSEITMCTFGHGLPYKVNSMYVCMYDPRKLRGVDLYPAATGGPARAYSLNRF